MDKYYVYKDGEYFDTIAYDDFNSALDVALACDCDEIECHRWDSEESYKTFDPAKEQFSVWKRDRTWGE